MCINENEASLFTAKDNDVIISSQLKDTVTIIMRLHTGLPTKEEWEYKDDLKFLRYDDPKVIFRLMPLILYIYRFIKWFGKIETSFYSCKLAGSHVY